MRWTGRPLRILALLSVAVAVACGVAVPDEPGAGTPPSGRSSGPARTPSQSADDFVADVRGAVTAAERYWSARFNAAGRRFQPIREVVPYRRSGELACAGEP